LTKHTILFLAANPLGTDRLALDQEARSIQVALERSGHRDRFELVTRWAAQPLDLLDELRKLKPTVVHFSGHSRRGEPGEPRPGARAHRDIVDGADLLDCEYMHGLYFQGPDGGPRLVSTAALQDTFGAAGSSVKLVVLSACYSEVQAEALLAHVGCVVGMGGSIRDDATRSFAIGFYGGIGEGESVAAAYQQGRAAISLEGLPDKERPQLKIRDGIDADRLVLADPDIGKPGQPHEADAALTRRGWAWYSSVESVESGDVSVLAILETIAASAVYAWIAWRSGTLHLTISACVAPFLLMRTDRSESRALDWFHLIFKPESIEDGFWRNDPSFSFGARPDLISMLRSPFLLFIIGPPFVALGFLLVTAAPAVALRALATATIVVRQPLKSISAIPQNLWRSMVSVDSCCRLELLHGAYRRYGSGSYDAKTHLALMPWAGIKKLLSVGDNVGPMQSLFSGLCGLAIAPVILVPALFYRWSLKGSALIYSPLVWIVRTATARPLRTHLHDILKLAYYRVARTFALLVILAFVAKAYIYYAWSDLALPWGDIPGSRFLDVVLMPEAFPPWQIASVINALLAWCLYLTVDWVVVRWDQGAHISERVVESILRWLSLVRGLLSVYTIFCSIYLVASLSGRFDLPSMGARILPWR
jgi:hypothetical protein